MTVPVLSILFMVVTLLVCFGFPIVLWVLFAKRYERVSTAVLLGMLGFVVPQLLIRIPILQLLAGNAGWIAFCTATPIVALAAYALSAGLFETAGRCGVFFLLRKRLSYPTALSAGLGHGAVEAVVLVGLTYINNIVYSILINLNQLPDVAGLQSMLAPLATTASPIFLMAGVERLFTMVVHMALSVLLWRFFAVGKAWVGFFVCTAAHFGVDFVSTLLAQLGIGTWGVELAIGLMAALGFWLIRRTGKKFSGSSVEGNA